MSVMPYISHATIGGGLLLLLPHSIRSLFSLYRVAPPLFAVAIWGCSSKPPVEPVAAFPRSLTGGRIVGIGGTLPDRDGISRWELSYEPREPGHDDSGIENYTESLDRDPFGDAGYGVRNDSVLYAVLSTMSRDRGLSRVDLERVITALCNEYGASVGFDAPRTVHYPDRVDTVLVWDLDGGNRVVLEYWMFQSALSFGWSCDLLLGHFGKPGTFPRRELDCRNGLIPK